MRQDDHARTRAAASCRAPSLVWFAASILLGAGCVRSLPPDTPTSVFEVAQDEAFTLAVRQTARVVGTGVEVTLLSVPEDSRCPAGVTCAWAGNARVRLRGGQAGAARAVELNTTLEPRAAELLGLRVELLGVEPVPEPGEAIAPESYRARLRVGPAGAASRMGA